MGALKIIGTPFVSIPTFNVALKVQCNGHP